MRHTKEQRKRGESEGGAQVCKHVLPSTGSGSSLSSLTPSDVLSWSKFSSSESAKYFVITSANSTEPNCWDSLRIAAILCADDAFDAAMFVYFLWRRLKHKCLSLNYWESQTPQYENKSVSNLAKSLNFWKKYHFGEVWVGNMSKFEESMRPG